MRTLANIIWHFPFLGFLYSLYLFLIGGLMCITIVGIPMGQSLFQLAQFMLAPFSSEMVDRKDMIYLGRQSQGTVTKVIYTIFRILYFPFGLLGVVWAVATMIGEAISIIGIPCAIIWAKLLSTVWNPFGKTCVTTSEADIIRTAKAASN